MSSPAESSTDRHLRQRMQRLKLQPRPAIIDGSDPRQQSSPYSEVVSGRQSHGLGPDTDHTFPRLSPGASLTMADRRLRVPHRSSFLGLTHIEKHPVIRSSVTSGTYSEEDPKRLTTTEPRSKIRKRKKGLSDRPRGPTNIFQGPSPLLQTIIKAQSSKFAPLTFLCLHRYHFQWHEWIRLIQHLPELQVLDLHIVQEDKSQQDGLACDLEFLHKRNSSSSRSNIDPLDEIDGSMNGRHYRGKDWGSRGTHPLAFMGDRRPYCPLVHTLVFRGSILIPEVLEFFPNLETLAFEEEQDSETAEKSEQDIELEDDLRMTDRSSMGTCHCFFDGGNNSQSSMPIANLSRSKDMRSTLLKLSSILKDHCPGLCRLLLNNLHVVRPPPPPPPTQQQHLGDPMSGLVHDITGLACFTATTQVLARCPGLLDMLGERHYDSLVSIKILSHCTKDAGNDGWMTHQPYLSTMSGIQPFSETGENGTITIKAQQTLLETLGQSCLRLLEKCVRLETIELQVPLSLQALITSTVSWACRPTLRELGLDILELTGENALDPEEEEVMAMFIQSMCKAAARGQSSAFSSHSSSSVLKDTQTWPKPPPTAPLAGRPPLVWATSESSSLSIGSSQSSLDSIQSSTPFPSSSTTSSSDVSSISTESQRRHSRRLTSDLKEPKLPFLSTAQPNTDAPAQPRFGWTRQQGRDLYDPTNPMWWSTASSSPNSYSSATGATPSSVSSSWSLSSDGETNTSSSWTPSNLRDSGRELSSQSLEQPPPFSPSLSLTAAVGDISIERMSSLEGPSPKTFEMDLSTDLELLDPEPMTSTGLECILPALGDKEGKDKEAMTATMPTMTAETAMTVEYMPMYQIESVSRLVVLQFWVEHRLLVFLPRLERFAIGRRTFSLPGVT
ncbi:hypothetical protein BGW38_000056 [Lunasporangiospora selenospora]|uniref:Uncharacterized protein n=1 Tax=Lunasporangiospora selenospora TaxID=979761 RepID=A0A9P6FXJ4_9FUNG|nr:hypothetical protein BGW38_000056 [Lunasporangiospora selenospora]